MGFGRGKKRIHTSWASVRLFFSLPLTGPWRKVPRSEYILDGQAWLNVEAMKESGSLGSFGSSIDSRSGLAVAKVGEGEKVGECARHQESYGPRVMDERTREQTLTQLGGRTESGFSDSTVGGPFHDSGGCLIRRNAIHLPV